MLTQEEKAKAYDEAIERAKQVALTEEHKSAAEYIFPQLAESEDEKIRKTLLEYYTRRRDEGQKDPFVGIPADSVISWLEKQKYEHEVFEPIESTLEYKAGFKAGVESEKQKEQKPVHTAKEVWKEMRLEVYAQASGNRHEPNYSDDSTKMFSLCDIDEIFEKIGDSTVSSQPAEWSEKDEHMKDTLEYEMRSSYFSPNLINWTLSHLQPHCRPSEQSETLKDKWNNLHDAIHANDYDKKMLGFVMDAIRHAEQKQ